MSSLTFNIQGSRIVILGSERSICIERLDGQDWDAAKVDAAVINQVAQIYLDQLKAFYDVELVFSLNPERCSEAQASGSMKKIHQLLFPQVTVTSVARPVPKLALKSEGTPLWKVGANLSREAARFGRGHPDSFLAELNYETAPQSERVLRAFDELIDKRRKKKRSEDAEQLFQWLLQMGRTILKDCGGDSAAACGLAVHLLPLCLDKDATRLLEDLGNEPW